jgi:hypothetical protein
MAIGWSSAVVSVDELSPPTNEIQIRDLINEIRQNFLPKSLVAIAEFFPQFLKPRHHPIFKCSRIQRDTTTSPTLMSFPFLSVTLQI